METKDGASSAAAVLEVFEAGSGFNMDCASALFMIWYRGILRALQTNFGCQEGRRLFDSLFPTLRVAGSESTPVPIRFLGPDEATESGDHVVIDNPGVPDDDDFRRENAIVMRSRPGPVDRDTPVFGHPFGVQPAGKVIEEMLEDMRERGIPIPDGYSPKVDSDHRMRLDGGVLDREVDRLLARP